MATLRRWLRLGFVLVGLLGACEGTESGNPSRPRSDGGVTAGTGGAAGGRGGTGGSSGTGGTGGAGGMKDAGLNADAALPDAAIDGGLDAGPDEDAGSTH